MATLPLFNPADLPPVWRLPVVPEAFDRTPALSPEEGAALVVYAALRRDRTGSSTRGVHAARRALARLEEPLAAVHVCTRTGPTTLIAARRVLWEAMRRRGASFWAWDTATWREVCGTSAHGFAEQHGAWALGARHHVIACAYLLGGVHDIQALDLGYACVPLARTVFGAECIEAAPARAAGALYGPGGLGYRDDQEQHFGLRWALCLALLQSRSPSLEALTTGTLVRLVEAATGGVMYDLRLLGRALDALGILAWPTTSASPAAPPLDATGVPPLWAARCRAWYDREVHLAPRTRRQVLHSLYAAGRWLGRTHPAVLTPEQWDEDLALEYVHHLCSEARKGEDVSPAGQRSLVAGHQLGLPHGPQSIDHRLGALRRVFTDWQYRASAGDGVPARGIPVRFQPQQAFATTRHVRTLIQPDPRDIDLGAWYRLAYAAAMLRAEDLAARGRHFYPLALYRAMALLWVTTARRSNELRRLRLGCVRREWEPAMLDEEGQPLDRAPEELCYLHVPPNKTRGAFWIWIPRYTADAVAAWERERPSQQSAQVDAKDRSRVDYLFLVRDKPLGAKFLNVRLIPLLCAVAGVPEQDARGPITAHRGRSTRATLLRKLGVPLADIAAYLGHSNERMVRHYARTDDMQLALTIKRADEKSRLVEGLIDVPAAQEGRPNVFFFLGKGPEGKPRYCGNPAWASCPHRLACLKCRMYVGGDAAELLEAREGVLRFQTQVPMTPVEQAAADGDTARLRERLAELEGLPVPEPPGNAFVINGTAPVPLPEPQSATDADRRTALVERLAGAQRDLATARALGRRSVLVKALERQVVALEADIAALLPAAPAATADAAAAT